MIKIKSKVDKELHVFEFNDRTREKEIVEMWKKNKDGEQSIKLRSKNGATMEIKFKNIDVLIFDDSKLVSDKEIFGDIPDCPLM
jgi:hypothetical protein